MSTGICEAQGAPHLCWLTRVSVSLLCCTQMLVVGGLGAILEQEQADGHLNPIAYAS